MRIDLHMHSTASDGILTPSVLAEECFSLGLTHAALTDHDTLLGQREFLKKANELGLWATSGIELNAEHRQELHILGYGFDIEDEELNRTLELLAESRRTRASRIIARLAEKGYPIEEGRVRELAGEGVIGRPHIARALVEKGFAADVSDAFARLIGKGCPGEVPRWRITSAEAIRLIKNAGGKAVLAHPGCMRGEDYAMLLKRLAEEGLEGIEAFYPSHLDKECEHFCGMAEKFGLFVTAGSDFHGGIGHAESPGAEKRGSGAVAESMKSLEINR